jgi:hypothetical protein
VESSAPETFARQRALIQSLRGSRANLDLTVPAGMVREFVKSRSTAVRSVDLLPPRTLRVGVALGPLTRHVELDLLKEIHYRAGEWLPIGDLSGALGTLLRLAQVLPVKRDVMSKLDVRRGEGHPDRLYIDVPAFLEGSPFLELFPEDGELTLSDVDFAGGEASARIYTAI